MRTERLTVRIESELRARLRDRAKSLGVPESDLVRQALQRQADEMNEEDSVFDLLERAGDIGISDKGPSDLSTNKKYMEGFGRLRK
jgi:predicted DNA-binding protein